MDNAETLSTSNTQDIGQIQLEKTEGAIKNGQSRDTGNIEYTRHRTNKHLRKPRGQLRMDNQETLATLSTQNTGQINVKENRGDNQE